jgi:hypothetical protein
MVGPGIEPGTFGSVNRNSEHYTTEAVLFSPYLSSKKKKRHEAGRGKKGREGR